MQLLVHRRQDRKTLKDARADNAIVDRYYHEEAVRRVMEVFGENNRRQALLVMATGTGKTRLTIAIVDILMRRDWVKRVLFLADWIALVNQAKNAFKKHLPHATAVNSVDDKEDEESRVVFSTYPTMMNCIDAIHKDGRKRFGVGHFDLVVIDEAHRSVYKKSGANFEYFDSLLLGLTATPRTEVDRNTYSLFQLKDFGFSRATFTR